MSIALPTSVIGSNFLNEWQILKEQERIDQINAQNSMASIANLSANPTTDRLSPYAHTPLGAEYKKTVDCMRDIQYLLHQAFIFIPVLLTFSAHRWRFIVSTIDCKNSIKCYKKNTSAFKPLFPHRNKTHEYENVFIRIGSSALFVGVGVGFDGH